MHFPSTSFTEQQAVEEVGGSHCSTDPTGSTWGDLSERSLDAPYSTVYFTLGEQDRTLQGICNPIRLQT